MTGLWQVAGRSDLTFDDLVRLDFYYLENWSIWLDMHDPVQDAVRRLQAQGRLLAATAAAVMACYFDRAIQNVSASANASPVVALLGAAEHHRPGEEPLRRREGRRPGRFRCHE